MTSGINLGAISLERTHATFRPFKHRLITQKIFGAAVAIVWITAGLILTSYVLIAVLQPLNFELRRIFKISLFSFSFFCLLIIVVSYLFMAIKFVCGNQPHHHGATSRERKLTKKLFIVTVVFLLLTLPFIIMTLDTMISHTTFLRLYYSSLFLL